MDTMTSNDNFEIQHRQSNDIMYTKPKVLTIIANWLISNCIHYKMWYEITYLFLNVNGCTIEV